jgi:predicted helicase
MTLDQYIESLNRHYRLGYSTEHTFRGDLQQLIENLLPGIRATNEPKRQLCGAPDYILTNREIPLGFIEAKDIGDKDLEGTKLTGNKKQFDRYKASLDNLIFTDYLEFLFYQEGKLIAKIAIGEVNAKHIKPLRENYIEFEALLKNFAVHIGQTIKNPKRLAEIMAAKARLLSEIIEKALISDTENDANSTLQDQLKGFKQILIHDIDEKGFADVYSQTIAYGLFAARLHDDTLQTFTRQEAAELIPKSNPFLRKLFGYIAGPDIDDRIKWIVDSLSEVFLACDVGEILKNYGKATKMEDPIIHFYETFLSEYDPKLRKSRGVWYTPAPVVNFIVRAVDDILKSEFGLPAGIADTSKTKIKVNLPATDKRFKDNIKTIEEEVFRVQILDPATGTGTFLAQVVKQIHESFKGQQGIWSNYVEKHLLPRLNGFELLMASYAMAHLQLDLLLKNTGFISQKDQRLRIYLTNSLEEFHHDTGTLFANWLSAEANDANRIKRDTPVMCVIGNPPYSGVSSNNGQWINALIEDYKYVDGEHFNERKHWLNDDYVKFLRYGEHFIEKNGSGIVAFINPHGFLDNPTFRGMRWHLLKTYDKIYTIDLHGNSKKKEKAPDGSVDSNVFDIQQGVSINLFIKTRKKKSDALAKVYHYDLFGKRESKYEFLTENSIDTIDFKELMPVKPYLFFVPKSNIGKEEYETGFRVDEIFKIHNVGVVTANDALNISMSPEEHRQKIQDLLLMDEALWRVKYKRPKDAQSWKYIWAKNDASVNVTKELSRISYRPFDDRWTLYTGNSGGLYARPIFQVMQHFIKGDNFGLVLGRQSTDADWCNVQITKNIIDNRYHFSYKGIPSEFPLYLYTKNEEYFENELNYSRTPNLDTTLLKVFEENLELKFVAEKELTDNTFAPIDVLDYIYAILHSPSYRENYREFLKIDFPRVSFPKNKKVFWQLVNYGQQLRSLHLLESSDVKNLITKYPISGSNQVTSPRFANGKVYINDSQFFDCVPEKSWQFFIGGYQPAQKWLKDRRGSALDFDDIVRFQEIVVALKRTDELMKEIDSVFS